MDNDDNPDWMDDSEINEKPDWMDDDEDKPQIGYNESDQFEFENVCGIDITRKHRANYFGDFDSILHRSVLISMTPQERFCLLSYSEFNKLNDDFGLSIDWFKRVKDDYFNRLEIIQYKNPLATILACIVLGFKKHINQHAFDQMVEYMEKNKITKVTSYDLLKYCRYLKDN